jgi:hypothetical protein
LGGGGLALLARFAAVLSMAAATSELVLAARDCWFSVWAVVAEGMGVPGKSTVVVTWLVKPTASSLSSDVSRYTLRDKLTAQASML